MSTPEGHIWGPLTRVRAALSDTSAFQSWVGAADASAALEYIHLFEDRLNTAQQRFAVVFDGDTLELARDSRAAGLQAYNQHSEVRLGLLEQVAEYTEDNVTAYLNTLAEITSALLTHDNAMHWQHIRRFTGEGGAGRLRWVEGEKRGYQWYWSITEARQ